MFCIVQGAIVRIDFRCFVTALLPRTKNRNDSKCNYYRNRENVKRHTYVFSATLTMVHSGPQRIMKKRKKKIDEKQKLSRYFC